MHDVEGQAGLENCRPLMDLEESLGFRSVFNFVPEGEYIVPSDLRKEIGQRGCEIGVHDLHHDGKLYNSRKGFAKKAVRINEYLREWNAVGFRSGFMLNNLDWLHHLDIAYDASTFDTDPFEPQPEGRNTIFPFWVPRPNSQLSTLNSPLTNGYVELPYTLPQDSTLFGLLRETTPEIWFRKLNWVAENAGMAMIGVHPDYISFGNGASSQNTYPESLYRDFLVGIRRKYSGSYWNALPGEVASLYSRHPTCCLQSADVTALAQEASSAHSTVG
jgi:hypothetical protein